MNTGIKRFLSICLLGAALLSATVAAHAENEPSEGARETMTVTIATNWEKESALWDELIATYGEDTNWPLEVWAEYSERCAEMGVTLMDGMVYGMPAEDEVQLEQALEIAGNHLLETMGFRPEVLARLEAYANYFVEDDAVADDWKPFYRISYSPINVEDVADIGFYACYVSGKTGEVLEFLTPVDGKG